VLLVILAVILTGISVVWLSSARLQGINEASTEASQSQQVADDRNAPREVTPGKAFTVGKHETLAGWKVEDTSLGDAMFSVAGKVKNISDATSSVDYLSADPA
jgi:hypothetical protein